MRESNYKKVIKKRPSLISFNQNGSAHYYERCKVIVNTIKKVVNLNPVAKNIKPLELSFSRQFFYYKNIIGVDVSFMDSSYYLIILPCETKCKQIYDIITQDKVIQSEGSNKITSMLKILRETNIDKNIYQNHFGDIEDIRIHRKRNLQQRTLNDFYSNSVCINNNNDNTIVLVDSNSIINKCDIPKKPRRNTYLSSKQPIVEAPNFEVVDYVEKGKSRSRLYVFSSPSDKSLCHEYYYDFGYKAYICCGCIMKGKRFKADVIKLNGKEVVKIRSFSHICEVRKYAPEKYKINPEKQIIHPPNFKIISFQKNGTQNLKKLFIFCSSNKDLCYEFYWSAKGNFRCCGCKILNVAVVAELIEQNDGTEYIKMNSTEHVCELRQYDPNKYNFDPAKQIVEASNFEIITFPQSDKIKERLYIFSSEARDFCYEYFKDKTGKYHCCGCTNSKEKKNLSAKMCKNPVSGQNYLKLNSIDHICELRKYDPNKFVTQIVQKEMFEERSFKVNGVFKKLLLIFCSSDKKQCYEYYFEISRQIYICSGCHKGATNAKICENQDGEKYVKLGKSGHICTPREYNSQKYTGDIEFYKPNYEIIENEMSKKLIIYTSLSRKFCYEFKKDRRRNFYYCTKCSIYNHFIQAVITKNDENIEYVSMRNKPHVCQEIKVSTAIFRINKIIKLPNYELIKRIYDGKIIQKLVIFADEKKELCFEYYWIEKNNCFKCNTCKSKFNIHVYAKLKEASQQEQYIEMGPTEHKCKPIKYETEDISSKIIEKPNFKIINNEKRLQVFHPSKKNFGYSYNYKKDKNIYYCARCFKNHKYVTAKLFQKENDQAYIVLNKNEHVCEPQKF